MTGEDGLPTEAVAPVIPDVIEHVDPPFRRSGDEPIEQALRALDASDRFAAPFDISALG